MLATILGLVIKYLASDTVTALFNLLSGEMANRGLIQQGQAQQAAKETATAEATEVREAQAISDTPKDKTDALASLRAGKV